MMERCALGKVKVAIGYVTPGSNESVPFGTQTMVFESRIGVVSGTPKRFSALLGTP